MALYRGLSYFLRLHRLLSPGVGLIDGAISEPVVLLLRFRRLLTVKLSGLPDLFVASICGPRVSGGMRVLEPHRS